MTPEELTAAQIDALATAFAEDHEYSDSMAYELALTALSAITTFSDQHQPLTAKFLREGDPEGVLGDALKYGLSKHTHQGHLCLTPTDRGGPCLIATNAFEINYPEPTEQIEAVES